MTEIKTKISKLIDSDNVVFVGGCDIFKEMLENNEIESFLKDNNVSYKISEI